MENLTGIEGTWVNFRWNDKFYYINKTCSSMIAMAMSATTLYYKVSATALETDNQL